MIKILLHRVTTHKIHISTNDANFIHPQLITISRFSITCLNSTPQYKRKCSHFYYSISFVANSLSSTSLLLLGAFSGKMPCSITTKTYYFWQVSRFYFWATAEVVPWLLDHIWSKQLTVSNFIPHQRCLAPSPIQSFKRGLLQTGLVTVVVWELRVR